MRIPKVRHRSVRCCGSAMVFVLGIWPAGNSPAQEMSAESFVSHYVRGMELWRAGQAAEALPHLMTATQDSQVGFYAARQVSLMGQFALPVLNQGLWHREGVIQRQSAIILGWIGEENSVEALLLRMKFPDAPLEVEYALQKIGSLSGSELLDILEQGDLANPALLDRKVTSVARLADSLRLAVDPEPLLDLLEAIETVKSGELAEQPFGHLANARLNLSLFLAERRVTRVVPYLVGAIRVGADEENLALAGALIELGALSLEPLDSAFRRSEDPSLRALLAVAHYFAGDAPELAASGPISVVLNDASSKPSLAQHVASLAARFSVRPNALFSWFTHFPDPEVRKALAPEDLTAAQLQSRPELLAFFLDKTRDPELEVSVAHLLLVARYLPDPEVESRLNEILRDEEALAGLRQAALEAAARHRLVQPLVRVLRTSEDALRSRAVELCVEIQEPDLVNAVLTLLREPEPSDAKRAAIYVAAERWKRPEAERALMELVRSGDPLWREAVRGLAALGVAEAAEPFLALVDAGRTIDADEAGALYFLFTGIPARLTGDRPGTYQFETLDLDSRPPPDQVLVVLQERSDYRGWVKVEERWKQSRAFRLDEGRGELFLYDRETYDQVAAGAGVILLEDMVRQTVLDPLELSEFREQKVTVIEALPELPFAGLDGDRLQLLHRSSWVKLPLGKDLREKSEQSGWGRSALIPLHFFDRDRIHFSSDPPPSGASITRR